VLQISGSEDQVDRCKREIKELLTKVQEYAKEKGLSPSQANLEASFFQDLSKDEPASTNVMYKDFLVDPYAAAYYERYSSFQPGQNLSLGDLQFPSLSMPAVSKSSYPTFYQEYYQNYAQPYATQKSLEQFPVSTVGQYENGFHFPYS